jgi:hypothetical protein
LDGTFKSYTFNNIAWGKYNKTDEPYRSRGPYFIVFGFMNHLVNNSFYKFRHGIIGSAGNRTTNLGNVISNITGKFIEQNRPGDTSLMGGGDTGEQGLRGMPTNAYGYNVFFGAGPVGTAAGVKGGATVEEWQKGLTDIKARLSQTGWKESGDAFTDPEKHDFSVKQAALVANRGVKFFVPFGIYKMVGEWNFIHHPGNETQILGEGFYMDESFVARSMYNDVPRNDLKLSTTSANDYIDSPIESWAKGALRFDGKSRFAVLTHKDMIASFQYGGGKREKGIWNKPRETLDMDKNSFLIEIVFKTQAGSASSLVSKKDKNGYELGLRQDGKSILTLFAGGSPISAVSKASAANGEWNHLIAEVDRTGKVARFYINGKKDSESPLAISSSLSNTGDFYVGRGQAGYYKGDMAFLRVSRGTLADARTTIEELYAWQFDGPFLKYFDGSKRIGGGAAGAVIPKGVKP